MEHSLANLGTRGLDHARLGTCLPGHCQVPINTAGSKIPCSRKQQQQLTPHTQTHHHIRIYSQGENYDQLKAENRKLKNELADNKQYVSNTDIIPSNALIY